MTSLDQVDQSLKTDDDRRLLGDTGSIEDNRGCHSDEMKPMISNSDKTLLRV